MEIVVTGRHVQVSDRFRQHLDDKLAEGSAARAARPAARRGRDPRAQPSPVQSCDRVEITCHVKGPVIRAEACADDKYAALDIAMDKLLERLRRASRPPPRPRRGRHVPESVAQATGRLAGPRPRAAAGSPRRSETQDGGPAQGDSPIEVREKVHASAPMALDQALYEMELVGHDFYLFHDTDSGQPSVVYRRRGWSYGVIHLDVDDAEALTPSQGRSRCHRGPAATAGRATADQRRPRTPAGGASLP